MDSPPAWEDGDVRWDPEGFSNFLTDMPPLAALELARILAASPDEKRTHLLDPRDIHQTLYAQFVQEGHEIFAGSFRGCDDDLLREYEVGIDCASANGDTYVAPVTAADQVAQQMNKYSSAVNAFIDSPPIDRDRAISNIMLIAIHFLKAHPFADGNGHVCRIILPTLASFTKWPFKQTWSVNPSSFNSEFMSGLALTCASEAEARKDGYRKIASFLDHWII